MASYKAHKVVHEVCKSEDVFEIPIIKEGIASKGVSGLMNFLLCEIEARGKVEEMHSLHECK